MFLSSAPQASSGRGVPPGQRDRGRHVAARAPQEQRARLRRRDHPHDRVVGPGLDRPVVEQQEVGDPAQPRHRVVVGERDRLVGRVAAGHHQRPHSRVGDQQVVKRRVGEHQSQLGCAGRDRRRHRGAVAAAGEHDRSLGTAQQRALELPQNHQRVRGRERRDHQRERLVLAVLARPQRRHRGLIVGAAGQVKAADPLDREDPSGAQRPGGLAHRVVAQGQRGVRGCAGHQQHRRAAPRARVRLGVEPAVGGVVVLGAALGAHLKAGHRRQRPVVGDPSDDREPGTAGGAVDERVAMAAVPGIHQFAQTVDADRAVGCDRRVGRLALGARADLESSGAAGDQRVDGDALDHRQRRRLGRQPGQKPLDRRRVSLDLEQHATGVVEHVSGQVELAGQPVHVGPEPDPLHGALHPDPDAAARGHAHRSGPPGTASTSSTSSTSTWYALAWASWILGMCSERVTTTWSARPSLAIRPPS